MRPEAAGNRLLSGCSLDTPVAPAIIERSPLRRLRVRDRPGSEATVWSDDAAQARHPVRDATRVGAARVWRCIRCRPGQRTCRSIDSGPHGRRRHGGTRPSGGDRSGDPSRPRAAHRHPRALRVPGRRQRGRRRPPAPGHRLSEAARRVVADSLRHGAPATAGRGLAEAAERRTGPPWVVTRAHRRRSDRGAGVLRPLLDGRTDARLCRRVARGPGGGLRPGAGHRLRDVRPQRARARGPRRCPGRTRRRVALGASRRRVGHATGRIHRTRAREGPRPPGVPVRRRGPPRGAGPVVRAGASRPRRGEAPDRGPSPGSIGGCPRIVSRVDRGARGMGPAVSPIRQNHVRRRPGPGPTAVPARRTPCRARRDPVLGRGVLRRRRTRSAGPADCRRGGRGPGGCGLADRTGLGGEHHAPPPARRGLRLRAARVPDGRRRQPSRHPRRRARA